MKRMMIAAGIVVMGLSIAAVATADGPTYVGAKKCKMCHKVQYTSWESTHHAQATDAAKKGVEGRAYEAACLKCHATNADENLPGVQCEACHGPGSDYKKMSIMKDLEKAMANGLLEVTQSTCDGCHTGDDHSKKVNFAEKVNDHTAIHEFKNAELAKKMMGQ